MTVLEYIKQHTEPTHTFKRVKHQCKGILNEPVMSGGNDIYLAAILDINRSEIEKAATQKPARA
jgi:hypothetical protein